MDEGHTPLSELLNDEPSTEPAATPQLETEAEAQPRDEHGRFAPKEPTGVDEQAPAPAEPVPPTGLPKDVYEPLRAVRDENKQLREQLQALSQQFQSLQQPKEPPAPPPTIWEDEQGWQQHFGSQVSQQVSLNAKLDMSEMLASQSHDDFDAMKASFLGMAEQNPALVQQALADRHPWEKAYRIAKNAAAMTELGATDLDTLKAKLREELAAEMQAQAPVAPTLPPSLTTERSVGSRSGPAWAGPTPLSDLLR